MPLRDEAFCTRFSHLPADRQIGPSFVGNTVFQHAIDSFSGTSNIASASLSVQPAGKAGGGGGIGGSTLWPLLILVGFRARRLRVPQRL